MNNVSAFSEEGDSNWMFGTDKGVKKQVGGVNSAHNNAVDQITVLEATSKEHKNRKRLCLTIKTYKLLAFQGDAFRGHKETVVYTPTIVEIFFRTI